MSSTNNAADSKAKHNLFRQASCPDTPPDILMELIKSEDKQVRGAVALNKNTPYKAIEQLLNDKDSYVLSCLRMRASTNKPFYVKANKVVGNKLILRDACLEDAAFILELRTDKNKSKYLSYVSPDIEKQENWLKKYNTDSSQIYFIIQDKNDVIGTVRLYDQRDNSFCWGSWIIQEGSPSSYAIESAMIVYNYAFLLGFLNAHFEVRKGNKSVWKFHERFGAVRTGETEEDYLYKISNSSIKKSLKNYSRFLPNDIKVF